MKTFQFTLKLALAEPSEDAAFYIDLLDECGCDDALIGIGKPGRIALEFCREAESAFEAVYSAFSDVKTAIPNAKLIEATPDLIGISDIAVLLGLTRQNVRKLMISHNLSFPVSIHEGTSSIWHLASVLDWYKERNRAVFEPSLMEVASANMQLNIAKENNNSNPIIQSEISLVFP